VAASASNPVRVWDLPTRLFHWALATLVIAAWASGEFGGQPWLDWHFRFGYGVLALLVFRVLWGFAGDRYARFSSFPPSWRAALEYLRSPRPYAGHTPLGALSVYAQLLMTAVLVLTGMLSSDGDFTEGPWTVFVSDATVSLMSVIHRGGHWVLLALVSLHLGAIAWYAIQRKDNLVGAMVTGDRRRVDAVSAADDAPTRWRAVLLLVLSVTLVAYSVTL
jgi:cytochrome b